MRRCEQRRRTDERRVFFFFSLRRITSLIMNWPSLYWDLNRCPATDDWFEFDEGAKWIQVERSDWGRKKKKSRPGESIVVGGDGKERTRTTKSVIVGTKIQRFLRF
jgi:hypothetical protein